MLAINKWFDFPRGLAYNKIVEIAQNSSRNNTYYELRYHTGDVFMLKQGLYEQVVNTEIKDELRQLPEDSKHVEKIDTAESSSV